MSTPSNQGLDTTKIGLYQLNFIFVSKKIVTSVDLNFFEEVKNECLKKLYIISVYYLNVK